MRRFEHGFSPSAASIIKNQLRFPKGTSVRCHDDHRTRIPIARVPEPTVPIPSMPVAVVPVSVAVAAIVVMIVAPVRLRVLAQR